MKKQASERTEGVQRIGSNWGNSPAGQTAGPESGLEGKAGAVWPAGTSTNPLAAHLASQPAPTHTRQNPYSPQKIFAKAACGGPAARAEGREMPVPQASAASCVSAAKTPTAETVSSPASSGGRRDGRNMRRSWRALSTQR